MLAAWLDDLELVRDRTCNTFHFRAWDPIHNRIQNIHATADDAAYGWLNWSRSAKASQITLSIPSSSLVRSLRFSFGIQFPYLVAKVSNWSLANDHLPIGYNYPIVTIQFIQTC